MPAIITIAQMKGGVSKSTIAFNLTFLFAETLKVAVLDTDLQGSISHLLEENENINIITFPDKIEMLRSVSADIIIIDTPGYLSAQLPALLKISDLIIVPTKTGFWDYNALKSMIVLINEALIYKPSLKWGVILTMVNPQAKLSKEITSLLKDLEAPMFKTQITQRVSYVRSLIMGGILKSDDLKAKYEIINLADEVITLLQ